MLEDVTVLPLPARVSSPPRALSGRVLGALVAGLLCYWAMTHALESTSRLDDPSAGQDFAAFYVAAALAGRPDPPLYDPAAARAQGQVLGLYDGRVWYQPYLYPPVFAQALRPLTLLSYEGARYLWAAGSVALLLLALVLMLRLVRPAARPWVALLWGTLPHWLTGLYYGQADPLIAGILALGYVAYATGHHGRALGAIVAAGAIKLQPLVLVAVFWRPGLSLLFRHPRAGFLGIAAVAAPIISGWDTWSAYARALPGLAGMTRDWVENLSLPAAARRLAGSEGPQAELVAGTAVALLVVALVVRARAGRPSSEPRRRRESAAQREEQAGERSWLYASAVALLLLAAPVTWPSGLVLLLVPAAYLTDRMAARRPAMADLALAPVMLVLWAPDVALAPLPLHAMAYLRTAGLLALVLLLLFRYPPQRAARTATSNPDQRPGRPGLIYCGKRRSIRSRIRSGLGR